MAFDKIKLICNHRFHQGCINRWMQRANTCPLCRRNIQIVDERMLSIVKKRFCQIFNITTQFFFPIFCCAVGLAGCILVSDLLNRILSIGLIIFGLIRFFLNYTSFNINRPLSMFFNDWNPESLTAFIVISRSVLTVLEGIAGIKK